MPPVDVPLLTVEDYRNLPETGPRYQLIEGYLYMSPAPNRFHQDIVLNLTLILGNYLRANHVGRIYFSPFDVVLDEFNVFQPDILFVSKAREGIFTKQGAEGAPELVVEVLSPKTSRLDQENKKKMYAQLGVVELWIIDPVKYRTDVYRFQENQRFPVAVYDRSGRIETPLLPGLIVDSAEFFSA